jgi:hypothetical protein
MEGRTVRYCGRHLPTGLLACDSGSVKSPGWKYRAGSLFWYGHCWDRFIGKAGH